MSETGNKTNGNKEFWGCFGMIGAAVVTGIFSLIIALPTLVPLFQPKPTPTFVVIHKTLASTIEINLKNEDCSPYDFYVDNKLTVSSIQPGVTIIFSITPGQHEAHVCAVDTTDKCSAKNNFTWSSSTTHHISRLPTCP